MQGLAVPFPTPGVYHINWYIRIGLPFYYIFPILPSALYFVMALEGSYRLGLCPQPPRLLPCFFCHNSICDIVPLWLGMFLHFYEPILHIPTSFAQILMCWVP